MLLLFISAFFTIHLSISQFFEKAMPDSCILFLNSVKSSQNALHIVLTFLK